MRMQMVWQSRTCFVTIFSTRTSVHKHIAFLQLWVRTNESEFICLKSFVLVRAHDNNFQYSGSGNFNAV